MAKFRLRRYIFYYLGRAAAFLVYLLPVRVSVYLAKFLGRIGFRVLGKYRRLTIENLKLAFGSEKADEEIEGIARRVFENLARYGVELINFPKINKGNLDKWVTIGNAQILDAAVRRGKGIIILTAHFGNWELTGLTLRERGYRGCVIGRRIYFDKYDAWLNELRRMHDVNVIYRDESPRKAIKALRDNQIVGIVADQDVDSVEGVFVNFFGKPAYTPAGPVVLARATGAALIPALMIKEGSRHVLMVEKPLELVDTGNKEQDLVTNTQKWSDVIESYIRKYPDQWVWMHRRWKTKAT